MHPSLTNPFTTSAASVMRAVEPAAAPVTRPTPAAAAEPIHNSAPGLRQTAEPDVPSLPTCRTAHEDAGETSGAIHSSCRGGESRPATVCKEGVSYPEAQANLSPSICSYRTTGEEAPAGPRVGSRIETAGVASGLQDAESSNQEGGDHEALAAPCLEHSPAAGALDQVDHINEIFWFVRTKLMGQPRFVLNEAEFMAAIDEQPMFLQKRA